MKNIKFIFAALVSIAALSCNKLESPVENPESNQDSEMMTLVLSTGEQTKTYIAENGTDIYWHSGDKIKVYSNFILSDIAGDDASDYDFTMSGEPQGNFARFTGKVRQGTKTIWAVYPSALAKGANVGGVINVNLPSTQTASENSFSQNLNISVAKTDVTMEGGLADKEPVASSNVAFHNACALLKFTVPSDITNIKSVVISADQNIAGNMTINYSGDSPVLSSVSGSKAITMEGTFTPGKDYYFVLAPVAISELSIAVYTKDKKQYAATKRFETPMDLVAGTYKSLGTLNIDKMPSFGVDFEIQDENHFLNGTDVIFTFPSDDISNVNFTVVDGKGVEVRKIAEATPALNASNQLRSSYSNETVTSWPYLPKGKYTVSGTYESDGEVVDVYYEFDIDTDPNFTVGSLEAKTSYTLYKSSVENAVALANQFDGTKIEVTASDVKISDKILKNTNYKDLFKVQFATSPYGEYYSANLTNGEKVTLTSQQLGPYASPSYVFDTTNGVTLDNTVCHVTGIPYTLANDGTWKDSGTLPGPSQWSGNSVILGNGKSADAWLSWDVGSTTTLVKTLYTPVDIVVAIAVTGKVGGSKYQKTTGRVQVSNTTAYEKKDCKSKDLQDMELKNSTPTLLSNNPTVTLSNSDSSRIDDRRTEILSLTIKYK